MLQPAEALTAQLLISHSACRGPMHWTYQSGERGCVQHFSIGLPRWDRAESVQQASMTGRAASAHQSIIGGTSMSRYADTHTAHADFPIRLYIVWSHHF